MSAVIVIPARYGSSRFPGKPLALIRGRTLLQRVWEIARTVDGVTRVLIATDDRRLQEHAESFGAEVVMTSTDCRNGTERVAEALSLVSDESSYVVNLQGDAPLIPPQVIAGLLADLRFQKDYALATPAVRVSSDEYQQLSSARGKGSTSGTFVVFRQDQSALYFAKAMLPHLRDGYFDGAAIYRHLGIYAFTRSGLEEYIKLPPSRLERCEQLEQLRALEHGMGIFVSIADLDGKQLASVDEPDDVQVVEQIIERQGELVR